MAKDYEEPFRTYFFEKEEIVYYILHKDMSELKIVPTVKGFDPRDNVEPGWEWHSGPAATRAAAEAEAASIKQLWESLR